MATIEARRNFQRAAQALVRAYNADSKQIMDAICYLDTLVGELTDGKYGCNIVVAPRSSEE